MLDHCDIPNIRHLRMVQMIGKLGGVTCASRELNTSQPAVTQAILNLEAHLGIELFERRATGTYPTEHGQLFLNRLDRFFDIFQEAMTELGGSRGENAPPVEQRMTATHVRALLLTSDPSSVEQNAAELGISTATLYRSVRDLERNLGHLLFKRTAVGLICTKTGRNLASAMRRAAREIEFARGEIRVATGTGDVSIVLGTLPMAGSCDIATAVRELISHRPLAHLQILKGDYHTLLEDLRSGRVDMIYGLLRRPSWADDVKEDVCFHDHLCVAARKDHPITRMGEITPEMLSAYDWVVPAKGTPRRAQIDRLLGGLDRQPHFGIETSSMAILRALLCQSDMITVLPHSELVFDEKAGMLASMPCRYLEPLPLKGITTRKAWLPTEAHVDFMRFLRMATAPGPATESRLSPRLAAVS